MILSGCEIPEKAFPYDEQVPTALGSRVSKVWGPTWQKAVAVISNASCGICMYKQRLFL